MLRLVMVPGGEGYDRPRTKQRWIAYDFRTGEHRTREDARHAYFRALCPDPECRRRGVLRRSPASMHVH